MSPIRIDDPKAAEPLMITEGRGVRQGRRGIQRRRNEKKTRSAVRHVPKDRYGGDSPAGVRVQPRPSFGDNPGAFGTQGAGRTAECAERRFD